jgi:hypothetical protein
MEIIRGLLQGLRRQGIPERQWRLLLRGFLLGESVQIGQTITPMPALRSLLRYGNALS